MKAPDYTISDLAYYGGLMAGFITTYLVIQAALPTWSNLMRLAVSGIVGLVFGFATLKVYESTMKPPN